MAMLGERNHPLTTRAPGQWVEGRWVDGEESESSFRASIQPATKGDYEKLEALAEGRRVAAAIRIYTRTQLAAAGGDTHNGDIITYRGDRYLVTAASDWNVGMRGLDHYRYLAVRQPLPGANHD
jgi:hypothetical protein